MAHDHCHCRDYTRSRAAAPGGGPGRQGAARDRDRDAAPGRHGSLPPDLPLAQRGPRPGRLRRHQAPARRLRGGHRPGRHPAEGAGLDLLRRRHRLAQRPRADQRLDLPEPAPDPRAARAACGFSEDSNLFWHPSAASLRTLHGEDKVSVFPAIGYTSPNQSHFTSRHYYEIGELQVGANTGWLGRYIEQVGTDDNPLQGVSLSDELSPALATPSKPVAAVESVTDYDLWSWADDDPVKTNMFDQLRKPRHASPPTPPR